MQDLQRAWRGVHTRATPLPDVWNALKALGIKFRRGQVCMVAATPNAGKSMFALLYAIKTQVPTLFFSADTDVSTVTLRVAAHLTKQNQSIVESNLERSTDFYTHQLNAVSNIRWVFDPSPSLDDLEMELKAYVELFGVGPELIVIDNLMNVVAESDNEWAGLRQIMTELHSMARITEACVLVLHHTSEQSEYGKSDMPPPRRSIHGKVSQLPSLILTLGYHPTESVLRVAAVKNRFGPHSADGSSYASLFVNYGTCQIGDADTMGRMYRKDAVRENNESIA
jgi:RecA-family ATPase